MPAKPPHPLLSPSPPAFNIFQHQGLFAQERACERSATLITQRGSCGSETGPADLHQGHICLKW